MGIEYVKDSSVPLYVQFANQESGAYVKFDIFNSAATHLSSGTISHVGSGLYQDNSWQPTIADVYTITYSIWSDSGYSTLHPDYGGYYSEQTEIKDIGSSGVFSASNRHNMQDTLYLASSDNLVRNVASGTNDYVVSFIKEESASDWLAPIASGTKYFWYRTLGDTEPYKTGEAT